MGLTLKQERFATKYIELGNASEAYRQSYSAGKMKDKQVWEEASKLLNNPKVAQRVGELRAAHAEEHDVTVASLIRELEEARTAALTHETPQSSAAVAATMGKARITGLDKQILEHTGKDGGPISHCLEVRFVGK